MTERRVVLDASAVVAWARSEKGAKTVSRLLAHAVVPSTNLVEAIVTARARGHRMTADELAEVIRSHGVEVTPFLAEDAVSAAQLLLFSASHPAPDGGTLSLGDACCIAVAERLELPLVADDSLWPTLPIKVPVHNFRD